MKFKLFCAAAVAAFALTACSGGVEGKIDRLDKIATEAQEAYNNEDYQKLLDLGQEAVEIQKYLESHTGDISQEQALRLISIGTKLQNIDM